MGNERKMRFVLALVIAAGVVLSAVAIATSARTDTSHRFPSVAGGAQAPSITRLTPR